jgi:hypothetical protein
VQHPVLAALERHAEGGGGADVPQHLGVVAAGVTPVGQRLGVGELGLLVVPLHHHELGGVDRPAGLADGRWSEADEQVAHGGVVADRADELPHDAEPALGHDRAGVRLQVTGDDPQQRRLARAVGADQCRLDPVADPEADVGEQLPAVGQHAGHPLHVHVSHPASVAVSAAGDHRIAALRTGEPPAARPVRRRHPLALDDVGTGYSSLSYLQHMPVHVLKVDRSFVAALGGRTPGTAIVAAVVDLAHQLGLVVTAEGIETPEQHEILTSLACENGQGYLRARPAPAEEITKLLRAERTAARVPAARPPSPGTDIRRPNLA